MCKWLYDIIYYSATSIFCLYFYWDFAWNPFVGEHHIRESLMFNNWPQWPVEKYMEEFIIIQLGNHLFSTFDLIFFRRKEEPKFYEWMLHHFMACTLILYSALFNFLIYGILVL